jgi:thiol-disulfide isomerase/thioredoxin
MKFKIILILSLPFVSFCKTKSTSDEVQELSNEHIGNIKNSEKPTLIKFYFDWCGHCQHMAPIVQKIANDLKDKINVFKVEMQKNKLFNKIREEFKIDEVKGGPTFVIVKDGKEISRLVGSQPEDVLKEKILNISTNKTKKHKSKTLVTEITSEEELNKALAYLKDKKNIGVLKVSVEGCSHCTDAKDSIDKLLTEEKFKKIKFYNLNAEESSLLKSLIEKLQTSEIEGVPTIFLFKNGHSIDPFAKKNRQSTDRLSGFAGHEAFKQLLEERLF